MLYNKTVVIVKANNFSKESEYNCAIEQLFIKLNFAERRDLVSKRRPTP